MAYATTAALKSYLGISASTDDALLQMLLDAATQMIDNHVGYTVVATADSTRYLDAHRDVDRDTLWLGAWLAAAPTSVTNGDGAVVSAASYVREPRNGYPVYALRLKSSASINWTYTDDPENAIAVVGKWGYMVTPDEAIRQACVRLAAYLYRQKDNSTDLDRPLSLGGGVTMLPAQLPRDIAEMLRPYKWLSG